MDTTPRAGGTDDAAARLAATLEHMGAQDPSTPLAASALLGLDTETTGLRVGRDGIVSASLVLRDPTLGKGGDVRATWLIDPHVPISPGAAAVNGFTDEYVAEHGAEPIVALEQIASLIALAQSRRVPLLAYNAPFDVGMLAGDLRRWSLPSMADRMANVTNGADDADDATAARVAEASDGGACDDGDAADDAARDPWPAALIVDPLVIDRAISTRKGSRSLEHTAAYYGVEPQDDFHDATTDTIAALDLIAPMARLFAQVDALVLDDLMAWQRKAYVAWRDQFNEWARSKGRRVIDHGWFA